MNATSTHAVCLLLFFSCGNLPLLNAQAAGERGNTGVSPVQHPAPPLSRISSATLEHISVKDGLPENSVTCIAQDHLGYLWLGTQNGLVQYDGYAAKVFQPEQGDSGSISGRRIAALVEDRTNTLWIATLHGLNRLDRTRDAFISYTNNPDSSGTINSNLVHCMYEDRSGRFWVGTQSGLDILDRSTGLFTHFYFREGDSIASSKPAPGTYYLPVNAIVQDPLTDELLIGTDMDGIWRFNPARRVLSSVALAGGKESDKQVGWIQSFCVATDGQVWMASYNTLTRLDPQTLHLRVYIHFPIRNEDRYTKPNFVNGSVIEGCNGLMWAGYYARSEGVYCVDARTGEIQHIDLVRNKSRNDFGGSIFSLYQDRSGILWMGTWGIGLWKFDSRRFKFQSLTIDPRDATVEHPRNHSMVYDRQRRCIWYSTDTGLYRYDTTTDSSRCYLGEVECVTHYVVYSTYADRSGDIWLGTSSCGLIRFHPSSETYEVCLADPHAPLSLVDRVMLSMVQDRFGILWIATNEAGIYRYDIRTGMAINNKHQAGDSTSVSNNAIRVLFEDRSGTIWIGTNFGGLNLFDRQSDSYRYCGFSCIDAIHEDRRGNFWVADFYSGLSLFDRTTYTIAATYGRNDGLPSNAVFDILEDDHDNLWLGTDNGLLRFNTISRTFKRFGKEDGLPGDYFFPLQSCGRRADGTMYFSTDGGLVVFHPDSIRDDPTPPAVVITGVSLFQRPGERLGDPSAIANLSTLTLPHDQNDLTFSYVGLHFSQSERNRYRYYLENFDAGWNDGAYQRSATYTNLSPGRYVFHATASNRDGIWNSNGASVAVIITPPWWQKSWVYVLYAIAALGTMYFFWHLQLNRIRSKHAYQMTRFEAQKLREIDEMKSRFFTNISHEFRTPLTLILGPVKQMAEKTEDNTMREELGLVHRNARKLLTLVNQLLDIAKLESGVMTLNASPRNLIQILKAVVASFAPYAERKRITLRFNSSADVIVAVVDREKVETIVTNILANAFKFTPEEGAIDVDVVRDSELLLIRISDTGIGIPKEHLPRIFDRFYQVNGSHTRIEEGTGIGLSLTKELIELHNGNIQVESEEGKGTVVSIRLPLGKDQRSQDEGAGTPKFDPGDTEEALNMELPPAERVTLSPEPQSGRGLPSVLLVEDNHDVRHYIKKNLEHTYAVIEAHDGDEGWTSAIQCIPDVIVSDIMMPGMDGFALCGKLKTDERTSHIPVILLTAKAAHDDKLQGLEMGADEYLTKPFDPGELKTRIQNLIDQRKRLQEHFRRHGILALDSARALSIDKKFLQKVSHVITENLSNQLFGVELLAEMTAVSRSVLHRKIVSLTGKPPVELIRTARLNRAAELIVQQSGNISEIALEVGFANPAYFSECFRKQFGISPSQYLHEYQRP